MSGVDLPLVPRQTARWATWVYGEDGVSLDDPAESFHEASKVAPSTIGRQVEGARGLEHNQDLQLSVTRSVKRFAHREQVELPPPECPPMGVMEAIAARRSARTFGDVALPLADLSTILQAAYGVTQDLSASERQVAYPLRSVPSGGALYPLDLYVSSQRVEGLEQGIHHYDPLRAALEEVRVGPCRDDVADASTYPEIVSQGAAVIFVTAMFWRSRFKYGLRGYRFALLEAGHVAQNALLAATALGLAAVPLGGFYDRSTDDLLGLDGVNESTLYLLVVGCPEHAR